MPVARERIAITIIIITIITILTIINIIIDIIIVKSCNSDKKNNTKRDSNIRINNNKKKNLFLYVCV